METIICAGCGEKIVKKNRRHRFCRDCAKKNAVNRAHKWYKNNPDKFKLSQAKYLAKMSAIKRGRMGICEKCGKEFSCYRQHTMLCQECKKIKRQRQVNVSNAVWQKTKGREAHNRNAREWYRRNKNGGTK
jgi:RNA polymerase-binding transcription factor DksA